MVPPETEPRVPLDRLSLFALRIGIVGLVGYGLLLVWSELSFILLPFAIAVLLAALLSPVANFLTDRLRIPRAISAIVTVLLTIAAVSGLLTWIAPDIARQAEDLVNQIEDGIQQLPDLLHNLGLKDSDIEKFTKSATKKLEESIGSVGGSVGTGVISAAQGVVSVAASVFLALMMLIYLLFDGSGFWRGALRFAPVGRRKELHESGVRSWEAITSFVRSQVLVAAIDGIGIGVGLWIIGVPLAIPLGVLTFVLAFIPYIGAILAGAAAALVALSTNGVEGLIGAIIVTLIVQQLESNVLYPLLIGHSVKLHPLTVLLGVGAGSALLGITGAFLATPVIAAVAAGAGWLESDDEDEDGTATGGGGGPPEGDDGTTDAGGGDAADAGRGADAGGGAASGGTATGPTHRRGGTDGVAGAPV